MAVPSAVVTPTIKLLLLLHNCNFATIMNHNVSIKYLCFPHVLWHPLWKGHLTLQIENRLLFTMNYTQSLSVFSSAQRVRGQEILRGIPGDGVLRYFGFVLW